MADANRIFAPIARTSFPVPHEPRTYVVATIHREANVTQPRLGGIVQGLNELDELVLFPVHPRTRARIREEGLTLGAHVRMIEPLGYLELAALASQARVIVTDSGGLQKEAYWYGVPCVTRPPVDRVGGHGRRRRERPRRRRSGRDRHGGRVRRRCRANRPVLYGDGHASERIAQVLVATIPGR